MTFCFFYEQAFCKIGSALKRKNLLQQEQILTFQSRLHQRKESVPRGKKFYFSEQTPSNKSDRAAPTSSVSNHLKGVILGHKQNHLINMS